LRFHLVEKLQTDEIGRMMRSFCFSSFLAHRVSGSNVIFTCDLEGLSSFLGTYEAGYDSKNGKDDDFHINFI